MFISYFLFKSMLFSYDFDVFPSLRDVKIIFFKLRLCHIKNKGVWCIARLGSI